QVRAFSLELMQQLVAGGVKALVIACNTASAAVLRDARSNFEVPVFEVIVPAVRRAAAVTRTGKVGVIATAATVSSGAYVDAFAANPTISVVSQACPEFVRFVESGVTTGDEVMRVARQYLLPLLDEGIDTLVLGCTHYPFLSGVIQYVVGDHVTLVSSAEETAKDIYRGLLSTESLADGAVPRHRFESTGDSDAFERLAARFLRSDIGRA
ncbi:MAG: glutamate racemase, partial [Actinobacteria bacterium]|nr:glutamate racemase [Actinomycetota bacterium]